VLQCTVQSADTGGQFVQHEHNPGNEQGLQVQYYLPRLNSTVLSPLVEKGHRLGGTQVLLLLNEDSGLGTV